MADSVYVVYATQAEADECVGRFPIPGCRIDGDDSPQSFVAKMLAVYFGSLRQEEKDACQTEAELTTNGIFGPGSPP